MKHFLDVIKFRTNLILLTTTTIITRQLQIIYNISNLIIIHIYFSYERENHKTTFRSNNRIFKIMYVFQSFSLFVFNTKKILFIAFFLFFSRNSRAKRSFQKQWCENFCYEHVLKSRLRTYFINESSYEN